MNIKFKAAPKINVDSNPDLLKQKFSNQSIYLNNKIKKIQSSKRRMKTIGVRDNKPKSIFRRFINLCKAIFRFVLRSKVPPAAIIYFSKGIERHYNARILENGNIRARFKFHLEGVNYLLTGKDPSSSVSCEPLSYGWATNKLKLKDLKSIDGLKNSTFLTTITDENANVKTASTKEVLTNIQENIASMQAQIKFSANTFGTTIQSLAEDLLLEKEDKTANYMFYIPYHMMGLKLIKKDNHFKLQIYDPEGDTLRVKNIVFDSFKDISSIRISDILGLGYRLVYHVDNPINAHRNKNDCFLIKIPEELIKQ